MPPLIYSILENSGHLAVGPVLMASLVIGTVLNNMVSYTEDLNLYPKLVFTATFFAVIISLQQLKETRVVLANYRHGILLP